MSVLLSTAYLDEAERCDEVILLHEGRVLDQGTPGAIERAGARAHLRRHRAGVAQARAAGGARPASPGVVDAMVQGDRVRLVMAEAAGARPRGAAAGLCPTSRSTPVAPRFEDELRRPAAPAPRRGAARRHDMRGCRATRTAPPAPRRPVIEVHGLKRRFGDFYAVNGVSFEVRRGEIFGLLGANGAGKSTTFRMLCGLLPASAGTLRVAGLDLRRAAAAARARIGYMSQKFSLYGNLSVRQNLEFFASAYGLAGASATRGSAGRWREFELAALRGPAERRAAARLQAAPGDGLRADARARHPVPRRADLRRRSAGPARVLAPHQRAGARGRDRAW